MEVQHTKLFEVRDLHRFHGIGDMAECIDADAAKRLGIRHGTDAEGVENNDKNAVTGGILRLLSWFMFLRFAFSQKNFAHKMHKVF